MPDAILGVDLDALLSWMQARGLGSGSIQDAQLLTGGTQNVLLRFRRDDTHFVLRRPPLVLRGNSNETMQREARMLAALAHSAVPHPRLIAACSDVSIIGAAFYLMESVDGFNPTVGLPAFHAGSERVRHRMGLALVEGIVALGEIDYRSVGLEGFGKPDNYLERQVGRWGFQLRSYAEFVDWTGLSQLPGVERIAEWLENHRPRQFEPGIIHGDYHLANVLYRFDSPELAAIIDWELTTIGDPLLDLGWLMASWPDGDRPTPTQLSVTPWQGFPPISQLIDHYGSRSHRDLTSIDWYAVLACYKLGIILEGTHARASAGHADSQTGDRLHATAIGLFERALAWIR